MAVPKELKEWDENQLKPITERLSVEEKTALLKLARLSQMFGRKALGFDPADPLYLDMQDQLRTLGMRPTTPVQRGLEQGVLPWVFHQERGL